MIEKLGMRPAGSINPHAPNAPYYALYREDLPAPGAGMVPGPTPEQGKEA